MLHHVSWGQFFYISSALLASYYIAIGLLYYRLELLAIVKGSKKVDSISRPMPAPSLAVVGNSNYMDDEELEFSAGDLDDRERQLFNDADSLNDELADLFYACKCEEWTKVELVPLIQKKLRQYPHFANSSFAPSFISYIVDKAQEDCEMLFTHDEIKQLW
ncbi:hypothetical protein [Chitinophaga rhizophila]|uniref:Uncharacterized protein n=1 Tax=Chitinophaga rhizophila TaxID=2866212 RepID=A0ABS7G718_9BACT|nr:hypothetical protein [Chitinophaga rhizophila]MBW8683453.1 hypothetical protein [Chitinophaga rhizophila]